MLGPARRAFLILIALTAVNAAYLAAFDSATIFYHVNVLLHVGLGLCLALALFVGLLRGAVGAIRDGGEVSGRFASGTAGTRAAGPDAPGRGRSRPDEVQPGQMRYARSAYALAAALMVGSGLYLAVVGTYTPYHALLWLHETAAVAFLLAIGVLLVRGGIISRRTAVAVLGVLVVFPLSVHLGTLVRPRHVSRITNPPLPPLTSDDEGMGMSSPFFPSSNRTASGDLIRSDFFLESKSCGNKGCHPDITAQWESSAHHFSSFNNQWYRKSIEYMQDTIGTKPSKWCGGCHDMAILLTGRMDTPIRQQIHTPEAQAGIGCLVCHSIVHVADTMGQGGFTLEYPEMHRLVASKNPMLEFLHDRMVLLDPGPHKATMLKPFHRESTPEFCSTCHKVHLDRPVNHYRWFRGFNDYDAWQQSGVSGQGARAFYYPDTPKKCGNCHMPLVRSNDMGNIQGMVHSHRFPGANTALPVANKDAVQLEAVQKFLQAGILTVDIFAVSEDPEETEDAAARERLSAPVASRRGEPSRRVEPGTDRREADHSGGDARSARVETPQGDVQAQSMFPGESGFGGWAGTATAGATRAFIAPIERAVAAVRPGTTVRVDVVARTRKIGHFFPGGTVDAFDVWLELKAEDARGRILYWNGWVADGGEGPVDPGAHFYRSLMLDDHGNRINKRNAWSARAAAYVRLIPPGAADTAHFRLRIPDEIEGPIKLTARMNYRKFSWWNTQWAFAGVRNPAEPSYEISERFDDGRWVFTGDTADVSGQIKSIPLLPTVVVAEDVKLLRVGPAPTVPPALPGDRERWNDFGIGLLLQRDYRGAAIAFGRVTEIEPDYADGWVNRARVAVEEGDHALSLQLLDAALRISPTLPKAHYFRALALRTYGRYDEALAELRTVTQSFPRDRVVWNAMGRVLFLQRRFQEAAEAFDKTLAIDPEDVTAHYNLMLCYRGLHDEQRSKLHERLYTRFKVDESAQFVTGLFRLLNSVDNRERQPIHEHDSTWTREDLEAASGAHYGLESQTTPALPSPREVTRSERTPEAAPPSASQAATTAVSSAHRSGGSTPLREARRVRARSRSGAKPLP